ncbi:MAG: hypothetical protein WDN45_09175 [Caulobacteraceae bacterium]
MTDELPRCAWRGMAGVPIYEAYHDTEWGVPERDSRRCGKSWCWTASRPACRGSPF